MTPEEILRTEAAALLTAADRMDAGTFDKAARILSETVGKVIVTGAGTSGIIARKLAATLTSTGTPALFLHPGDAMHGGLGLVASGDVVVAISNSGETAEVLAALPYLRSRQVSVVAVVGNPQSSLGRQADVVLEARADVEACPLNLAPTSSSTLAIAVGDALAIMVMERRGVTPDAFARNHPSGRLGRRLTLRVADLMHPAVGLTVLSLGAPFLDAVAAIGRDGLGAACVVDDGRLVGILTDGDVRRGVASAAERVLEVVIDEMMTVDPVTVPPDLLAAEALRLMEDRPSQISVLPVTEDSVLVGLVRLHDLVRAGL